MRPAYPFNDAVNCVDTQPVLPGEVNLSCALCVQLANFDNVIIGELGGMMRFARSTAGMALSALCDHISGVVGRGSGEQMRGIDARRIVAAMQDLQSRGDGAIGKLPSEAVGRNFVERAVALNVATTLPLPAIVRAAYIYLLPKANRDGPDRGVMPANKSHRFAFESASEVTTAGGNRRGLTATAHAQAAWIRWLTGSLFARIVPFKEPTLFAWILGRGQQCSAATFAKFGVRKFGLGLTRGMLGHVVSASSAIGQSQGRFETPPGYFYWGATRSILPQEAL